MTREDIERLHELMQVCFKHDGPYPLSSGKLSNYYYDGKLGTLDPALAWLAGNILLDVILDSRVEAIGGLEIGSIPIADAIGLAAHLRGRHLPTFIVRKEPKKHGTRNQTAEAYVPDGPLLRPGRRVAIVDDVITTGRSIEQAIQVVTKLGCEVTLVMALVERHESQRQALRNLGIPILTVFYTDESGRLFTDEGFAQRVEAATPAGLVRR